MDWGQALLGQACNLPQESHVARTQGVNPDIEARGLSGGARRARHKERGQPLEGMRQRSAGRPAPDYDNVMVHKL
jgi:hypothetical protein